MMSSVMRQESQEMFHTKWHKNYGPRRLWPYPVKTKSISIVFFHFDRKKFF